MPKRCALGCQPSGTTIHAFPDPTKFPGTFKSWVEIAGGNSESPEDTEYYRKKVICDIHFEEKVKNRNKRLNRLAVPTLFIHRNPVDRPTEHDAVQQPSTFLQSGGNAVDLQVASHSTSRHGITIENPDEHIRPAEVHAVPKPSTYIQKRSIGESVDPEGAPRSTFMHAITTGNPVQHVTRLVEAVPKPSTSMQRHSIAEHEQSVFLEHNYCRRNNKNVPLQQAVRRKAVPVVCRRQQQQIRILQRKIRKLKNKSKDFKARLANAEKLNDDRAFKRVTQGMTSSAKLFTNMQFRQTRKKPSGRRFSVDEKILSLSIFKKSRKCYALLAKLFALPSPKTLRLLLAEIKMNSGINRVIFDKIKETVQKLNEEDRLCSLIFDEMSLTPQVQYDNCKDELKGFSDFDKKISDHVLVFMIKGVKANFKQPVAYYFTNSIGKYDLKRTIKEVVKEVQATGLIILCTICDQGTANVGAINELIQDTKNTYFKKGKAWRHDHFQVDNKQIIPLYDVPHLIKGLRNNLLNKDLTYVDYDDKNKEKVVKWEFFQKVYAADKSCGDLTLLHKLTEEHLNPEKIKKMRVKTAAQVFSHSVAVATEHLTARGKLDEECRQLIPFVSLIDKLFDSLNSSTFHVPNGKLYKACVRRTSPHHDLWQKALKTLKSMKFIQKKKTGNKVRLVEMVAPTIKNFVKTIEGIKVVWKIMSTKYSFDSMLTRNLNQDPLENFFGNIRSYGVRNIAPNAVAFEGTFKALLLNNYNAPHSIHGNCEDDGNSCLKNFDFFLKQNLQNDAVVPAIALEEANTSSLNIVISEAELIEHNEPDNGQRNYVCGWVLTKCLKNIIKGCKTCKDLLITKEESEGNQFIRVREYHKKKRWLVYPSDECVRAFGQIQAIAVAALSTNVPKKNIKNKIKRLCEGLINFPCNCQEHCENVKKYFMDMTINVIVYSWCRSVNRILAGKIIYSDGDDETKTQAQVYCNKHKHNKVKK